MALTVTACRQDIHHIRCHRPIAATARAAVHRSTGLRAPPPGIDAAVPARGATLSRFRDLRAEAGRTLPDYVQEEFDAYP
jgi:hypothetical protein